MGDASEDVAPLLATDKETPQKWGLFNVVIMGVGFLLLLSGFNTASSYLTTALPQDIGFYSLAILYAAFALSNFVSAAFVRTFGPRVSMIFAACLYLLFIFAAVKVIVPVYLVASALCGFGAAILWTAQGSFLTRCSTATNVGFHTGLFFALCQANSLIGYPIAVVLVSRNLSFGLIFSVLLLIAVSGVATLLILRRVNAAAPQTKEPILHLLASTLSLFKDPKMLAMFVLIFYSGFSASFFVGAFTKTMGKQLIGWAQLCFGVAEVIGSFGAGRLMSVAGRMPILAFTFIAHLTAIILVYWSQFNSTIAVYCLATAMFGLGDSTLQTTVYSILANLYSETSEHAFAYYKFAQSLGYTVCFLISVPLQSSLSIMVIILAALLVVAAGNMLVLHYKIVNIDFTIEAGGER